MGGTKSLPLASGVAHRKVFESLGWAAARRTISCLLTRIIQASISLFLTTTK
jgi:hypothetical protein